MSRVAVRSVQPVGLHGFAMGQLELTDLGDGLTVIWAPNATGKSTLARAIGLMFNPSDCPVGASVLGNVRRNGRDESVNARRKGTPFPGFPGRFDPYRLDLVQMLQGLKKEDLTDVYRLIGDGLDLSDYPGLTKGRIMEVENAQKALEDLRVARRSKEGIAATESRIPILAQELAAAEEAEADLAALEQLRVRRERQTHLATVLSQIDAVLQDSPGIERQADDAVGHANSYLGLAQKAKSERERAADVLRTVHQEGSMPDRDLAVADREALKRLLQALASAKEACNTAQPRVAKARSECESLRESLLRLMPTEDPDAIPAPEGRDFESLRSAVSEADAARSVQLEQSARQAALAKWKRDHPASLDDPERITRSLLGWLGAEPSVSAGGNPWFIPAAAFVTVGLVVVIPDFAIRGIVGVVGLAVIGWLFYRSLNTPVRLQRPAVTGLPSGLLPAEPTVQEAAEALLKVLRERSASDVATSLETTVLPEQGTAKWLDLAATLRLKCEDPAHLAPVASAAMGYVAARAQLASAEAEAKAANDRLEALREELRRLMTDYRFPTEAGREQDSAVAFERWFEAAARYREATANEVAAWKKLSDHLDQNGVPPEEDVEKRVLVLSERRAVPSRLANLRTLEVGAKASIEAVTLNRPRLSIILQDPDDASDETVTESIDRLQHVIDAAAGLREQLEEAKGDVRNAERTHSIADKESAYESVLDKVELKWKSLISTAIGARVAARVQEKLCREDLPELLQRANVHLGAFTSGRFRLELSGNRKDGPLIVRDSLDGKSQPFDELSTGTKIHVMIAFRLGQIEDQEHTANGGTARFPLVADEALAVSDPASSQAVASSLAEVSKTRQVIVFTNKLDDLDRFRKAAPGVVIKHLGAAPPVGPRRTKATAPSGALFDDFAE